ncbi:MAG TPA: PAS domain S-box protein [Geothrix sp.]|nr:PAS domain S-box protein [Geothrix sp.]
MTEHQGPDELQRALAAAEERAAALERRLQKLHDQMNAISEAIYVQDAEGRFLEVNEGAVRMYGHSRSFFLGKTPEFISAPGLNDLEAVNRAFTRALHGHPEQFEFWGLRKNGEVFPKSVRLYPSEDQGQPVVIAIAQDISQQKRAERTQQATYRIAEAAMASGTPEDLFARIHAIIKDLMPAENLYFALWDKTKDSISFPYWVDQLDPAPEPRSLKRGLTEYVLHSGEPLLLDREGISKLNAAGEIEALGSDSLHWMGIPLRGASGILGALVVQIYKGGHRYTSEERDLLVFVSGQLAHAIERSREQQDQRLLTEAMDRSQDAVFGINKEGRFVFVNSAACQVLGYAQQDLLALNVWDVDPHVKCEEWPQRWQNLLDKGTNREETLHRHKDGSLFPVEIRSGLVHIEGRSVIFTHARDITERKAADDALRLSEEKFSKAFQASPDAININQLDGTYVDINEAFTRMSGWTREDVMGKTPLGLGLWANPSDRDIAMGLLKAHGHFSGLEIPFRMKDGSIRTGLLSGTIIQVDGKPCMLSITRDISERKAVETALRASEDKFSRAFHASPDAIILSRLDDGIYLDVNQGFERIIGWTREESVGHSSLDLNIWANPEDREKAVAIIREQGEFAGLEFPFRTKNGQILIGQMSGKIIEIEGQPCLLSVTRDITSQKASEEALRKAELRLRTVLANSQAVIYQLDPEGRFTLSEGLGLANLGLVPGQVVGLSALDVYRDNPAITAEIRDALEGRASRQILKQQGRTFDNLLTPVLDDHGRVESVIGIATDVTERQAAEEALMAERGLFVGGPVMIFQWRAEAGWPVEYASPNVESILGYSVLDLIDGKLRFVDLIHPEDLTRLEEEIAEREANGVFHYEQQYRLRTASGEYRWFYDFTAAAEAGPRPKRFLGYLLDITDRHRSEEALRHAQKLESLGILAGGIAHDFNNLLTVVLGNLNLAQMSMDERAPAHPFLRKTEAAVLRATELTRQMLAYSGRGAFQVEPRNLNGIVKDVTHLLEVSIPKKVELHFDLAPALPSINADGAQIQQVVMNLVTNASDAIGDQEGAIHLRTRTVDLEPSQLQMDFSAAPLAPGRFVILEVEDTGMGMSAEVKSRIFDPFFTTKARGRGLGLSAMLGILRGHGGGLQISSEVGKGSTFRLYFPASEAPQNPFDAFDETLQRGRLKGRVLVVDDEALIIETLQSALEVMGLEVLTAADGLEALVRFGEENENLSLVIMDLTMPRMDGREAFENMREMNPRVPIVLSSGYMERDSLQSLAGSPPDGFIQKPYQMSVLEDMLHRLLGG